MWHRVAVGGTSKRDVDAHELLAYNTAGTDSTNGWVEKRDVDAHELLAYNTAGTDSTNGWVEKRDS